MATCSLLNGPGVVYDADAMADVTARRVALYVELRQAEVAKREHADDLRKAAWWIYWGATRSDNQWRDGFARMFRRLARDGESDLTRIPRYDTFAQWFAEYYPAWADKTEELWAFLLSDRQSMPSSASTWRTVDGILGEYEPTEVCVTPSNAMPF